jgi:hypothetical protein
MTYRKELETIIHSLSIAAPSLADDESALVDGLLDRAHTLAELPDEQLTDLVNRVHGFVADAERVIEVDGKTVVVGIDVSAWKRD